MIIRLLLLISFSVHAFDHTHQKWDQFLAKVVTQSGHQSLVDYKKAKRLKSELDVYLKELEKLKQSEYKSFTQEKKLALLINLYNAYTVDLIIKHYPVKSIKKIGPWYSSPWRIDFIPFLGMKVSLDHIEHGLIRKKFKEPRIHFAVNCASIGCPSLYKEAFVYSKLGKQLDAAAVNFMNNPKKNYLKGSTMYLSKIFDWYGEDFENAGGLASFIKKYYKLPNEYEIEFLDYDWKLNDL
jgi:hypothetical protein